MKKKVAVISGGTSGIGKRMVSMFLKSGVKVVTFSRKKSNINKLKSDNLIYFPKQRINEINVKVPLPT